MIKEKASSVWKWVTMAAMPIVGFALAVAFRSPKAKPQRIEVKEPDMKLADENVEKLVQRQEETKVQHEKIEAILAQAPSEPKPDLESAVAEWNRKD